jgi:hypothetical protein
MQRLLCHNKIKAVLSESVYRKLKNDPTSIIERITSLFIKKANIPDGTFKRSIPQASVPPRLYGLPNIHKEETSLRPTVNCIASPTQPGKVHRRHTQPVCWPIRA